MPLDNFDKRIREVTENNLPPFNESDWEKMEILLDKNLPIKKDRRRFLFLLFSFLLLGLLFGGIYINNTLPKSNTVNSITFKKLNTADSVNADNAKAKQTNSINKLNTPSANNISTKSNDTAGNVVTTENKIAGKTSTPLKDNVRKQIGISTNNNFKTPAKKFINTARLTKENKVKEIENKSTINNIKQSKFSKDRLNEEVSASVTLGKILPIPLNILSRKNDELVKKENIHSDTIIQSISKNDKIAAVSAIVKTITPTTDSINRKAATAKQIAKKNKIANKNEAAITVTTGVESSGTRLNSQGKLTTAYGVGLQYSVGKKITLRIGLNATKKIYTAKNGDYKAPLGSWAFNVTFKNILADCKVLEFPFSIAYKIKAYKKSKFYATIGLSSFFMKREDYQFFYKAQNGNDTTRAAHFTNNSNHLFSSLNISTIAEQKITNRFSILIEPFIKLPLGGIGFGKVKLYNTGVLLTAKIKIK